MDNQMLLGRLAEAIDRLSDNVARLDERMISIEKELPDNELFRDLERRVKRIEVIGLTIKGLILGGGIVWLGANGALPIIVEALAAL